MFRLPLPGKTARGTLGKAAAILLGVIPALLYLPARGAETKGALSIPPKDSPEMSWWRDSMKTRDERLAWWREARFGMFIHWGVYSYLGGTYEGQPVKGYAEHIQRILRIPIPVYREQVVSHFNPVAFNAEDWVQTAQNAGMGYIIITAKHHDGFAMFDSKTNDYNVVKATPFKRDPMKELKAACQKCGVRFGFYYSQAFDWGDANAPGNDWDYENPGGDRGLHGGRNWWESSPDFLAKARIYVDHKAIPQLLELIRNYDPDILWFDTPQKLPDSENLRILKAVRQASPRVVINGRLVRNCGDYASTADRPAEFAPHDGDWEGIPTTNESYGWNRNDHSHKPPAEFIRLLAKAAARGGNILLNIGPRGDGTFDPADGAILDGIGRWWKVNGESIRGTTRTPLPVQAWGESTRKGSILYLHVCDWPRDGQLVVAGVKSPVTRAWLLADKKRSTLAVERLNPLDLRLAVPVSAPDPVDSVVVLETQTPLVCDQSRLLLPAALANCLRVFDGERHGKALHFGAGKTRDAYVDNWTNSADFVQWNVRLDRAATFEVSAVYDAPSESAGGTYTVSLGSETLHGTVSRGENLETGLGRVRLSPGAFNIRVKPDRIQGNELIRLRNLNLRSVGD